MTTLGIEKDGKYFVGKTEVSKTDYIRMKKTGFLDPNIIQELDSFNIE